MNHDKVYIIVKYDGSVPILIESVWSTTAMAKSAIQFHAKESNVKISDYKILKREVNTTRGRRDD